MESFFSKYYQFRKEKQPQSCAYLVKNVIVAFRTRHVRPQGKVLSGELSKVEMMESGSVEKADVSLLQSCALLPQKPLIYSQRHLLF